MNAPEFASSPHPVCTTSEAARRLGVSSTTVQVMAERGELKAWRTRGGHRRISVDSVESIQRQRSAMVGSHRPEAAALCVLVMEHGGDGAESYAAALRAWGWPLQVLSAADGLEALLLIERRRPDIVIMDMELPRFDGLAFTQTLRGHHEFDAVQIVALAGTAGASSGLRSGAIAGVAVYAKPVSIEKLQGFIEAHLLRQSFAAPSPVEADSLREARGGAVAARLTSGASRQRSQGATEAASAA